MSSSHSHKRKNSHLFLQRKNSSSADMSSYEMNAVYGNKSGSNDDVDQGHPDSSSGTPADGFSETDRADIEGQFLPNSPLNWHFKQHVHRYRKFGILVAIVSALIALGVFILPEKGSPNTHENDNNRATKRSFTIDEVLNGDFFYEEKSFHFLRPPSPILYHDADPGLYITTEGNGDARKFMAKHLYEDSFQADLGGTTLHYNGVAYPIKIARANYDLDKMIIGVNIESQFRYSSKGLYFLKDLETGDIDPISPFSSDDSIEISYAHFSPRYNFIYFVFENNLYIRNLNSGSPALRVTIDGSNDVFFGKPDWIYEEEILSDEQAVWWSPDDSKVVYAKINDTDVEDYYIPKYTTQQIYSPFSKLKYPKPGTPNPKIALFMLDLRVGTIYSIELVGEQNEFNSGAFSDFILYDADWIDSENFIFKISDRTSKKMMVRVFNTDSESINTVRIIDATHYDGWIEKSKKILPIPPNEEQGRNNYGYVDIEADANGFKHIFYYETVTSSSGRQLTSGEWEVTGKGIIGYEYESDTIFFTANAVGPMAQQLYGVSFNADGKFELRTFQNPDSKDDFYDYELSSSSRFGVMKSLGPNVPVTAAGSLIDIFDVAAIPEKYSVILSDNKTIEDSMEKYDIPQKRYRSMSINDDVTIDYVEIRPAKLDINKKYPVLVSVYGGPGSQTYTTKYSVFFEEAVSSGLDAIVLQIEPRGTGGKGWAFKKWATGQIGYWEPRDVSEVTKRYISENTDVIDEERVAIWGWSYGAFSTLKTAEYDAGQIFKYAMAVAPVTNWTYYDSFYTERYMGDPKTNHKAYRDISAVKNIRNFGELDRFLIMHGSADDNVHIENTYAFLDQLDLLDIDNYDMHIFPDSDHSIQYHNAQHIIFRKLYFWLADAFAGHFDTSSLKR